MSTTVILVLFLTFAFAVGRAVTRHLSRYVTMSGVEYLLVGVLVGPLMPWTLITPTTLDQLEPLVELLTGLLGFLLGASGSEAFRRAGHALVGFVAAFVVALGTALAVLPVLCWVGSRGALGSDFVLEAPLFQLGNLSVELFVPSKFLFASLIIGAAAASASSYSIAAARRMFGSEGPVGDLLDAASRAGQICGVFLLGAVLASARATEAATRFHLTITEWEFAAILLGIVCGLLFGLFLGRESQADRIFLASIGLVTFASGIGSAVGISPIFVNMFAGLTVSLTSPHKDVLRRNLEQLQHPLFVLLMVFAGALWVPVEPRLWLVVPVFILARLLLRRISLNALKSAFLPEPPATRLLGSGLWSPGTLAVAIAVSGSLRFPDLAPTILSTVVVGSLVSELFSHRALRRLLDDAGELPPAEDRARAAEQELSATATEVSA